MANHGQVDCVLDYAVQVPPLGVRCHRHGSLSRHVSPSASRITPHPRLSRLLQDESASFSSLELRLHSSECVGGSGESKHWRRDGIWFAGPRGFRFAFLVHFLGLSSDSPHPGEPSSSSLTVRYRGSGIHSEDPSLRLLKPNSGSRRVHAPEELFRRAGGRRRWMCITPSILTRRDPSIPPRMLRRRI